MYKGRMGVAARLGPTLAAVMFAMIGWGQPAGPGPVEAAAAVGRDAVVHEGIRLNFRGASLDAVLDHLSQAAGVIIVKEADLAGTVDVWSHQTLNLDEAVELLNTVLNSHGLAAVRTERTLRIVSREQARVRDLPVQTGADPGSMPRSDSMVTQIIPVRYADAAKMVENLRPLLAADAVLTANQSSNAIILTDTQTNVRRIALVVQALDTSIANITEIRVFPLQHGDPEKIADIVNKVFETPLQRAAAGAARDRTPMTQFFRRTGGPRGDAAAQSEASPASAMAIQVTAVGDKQSNCVVVSAPADLMDTIVQLVKQVDIPVKETRELRVFPLQYGNAADVAEHIEKLFREDSNTTDRSGRGAAAAAQTRDPRAAMTRRWAGTGDGAQAAPTTGTSDRRLDEAEVRVVADTRTNSVIVTASAQILAMIETMIASLDETPKNVPQVYVYRIRHADIERLKEMLDGMFEDLGQTSTRTTTTQPAGLGAAARR